MIIFVGDIFLIFIIFVIELDMVAGNIEERIKKMKEAILTEAKERALMIVQNADF